MELMKIEAICVSGRKGEKKTSVEAARVIAGHGIDGDAHAGDWHRQISLLAAEDISGIREKSLPELADGDFAENIILSGIDLSGLGLGSRIRIGGDVELSITQIGKVCHSRCAIYEQTGDCIMPRLGLFARVVSGGDIAVGDKAMVTERVARETFQAVVITVSDRCSRGEAEDTAGPAIRKMLQQNSYHVYGLEVVRDDRETIADRLRHFADGHSIDLIVTVGGTGFSPNDVTPEAVLDVMERAAPGLDEAMRRVSSEKTPHAMLSRSQSGIRNATLIISLPGSERGATENLAVVLPALGHGLKKLRGDMSDCAPGRNVS